MDRSDLIGKYRDKLPVKKTIELYLNFNPETNRTERFPVLNLFKNERYCTYSKIKDFSSYLSDLTKSKFVLSPRGNGLDCYRTWEALLMGAFPIVKTSTLDPLFEDLPVIIVNDWNEINRKFLRDKYVELSLKPCNKEKLFIHYWIEFIESIKQKALSSRSS